MIIAGFPVNHTILNGQMERLNLNGMAKGMWSVVVLCWILKMKCPFSSLGMAF
jgi:hypothetical protein